MVEERYWSVLDLCIVWPRIELSCAARVPGQDFVTEIVSCLASSERLSGIIPVASRFLEEQQPG